MIRAATSARPSRRGPAAGHVALDLQTTGGERLQEDLGDAIQLGHPLVHRAEADTEGIGQAGPKGCLVEEPSRPGVEVEEAGIGCRPGTVLAEGRIGHQDVGVELGVTGPGGPVLEAGSDQPLRSDPALSAGPPADSEGIALQIAERVGDRFRVDPAGRRPSPWDHPGRRGGRPTSGRRR